MGPFPELRTLTTASFPDGPPLPPKGTNKVLLSVYRWIRRRWGFCHFRPASQKSRVHNLGRANQPTNISPWASSKTWKETVQLLAGPSGLHAAFEINDRDPRQQGVHFLIDPHYHSNRRLQMRVCATLGSLVGSRAARVANNNPRRSAIPYV